MQAKTVKSPKKVSDPAEQQPVEQPTVAKAAKKNTKKSVAEAVVPPVEEPLQLEIVAAEKKKSTKKHKQNKLKVIRDSFSFPEQDYQKIADLKQQCLAQGVHVKKSELLRAGLHLLSKLEFSELQQAVEQVEKIKTGRPGAEKSV